MIFKMSGNCSGLFSATVVIILYYPQDFGGISTHEIHSTCFCTS